MKILIKNEFRQTRRLLLIWLGIMLLLCGFCYFELLSLQDSLDEMAAMVSQFPRLIMIMFGVKGDLTSSPPSSALSAAVFLEFPPLRAGNKE